MGRVPKIPKPADAAVTIAAQERRLREVEAQQVAAGGGGATGVVVSEGTLDPTNSAQWSLASAESTVGGLINFQALAADSGTVVIFDFSSLSVDASGISTGGSIGIGRPLWIDEGGLVPRPSRQSLFVFHFGAFIPEGGGGVVVSCIGTGQLSELGMSLSFVPPPGAAPASSLSVMGEFSYIAPSGTGAGGGGGGGAASATWERLSRGGQPVDVWVTQNLGLGALDGTFDPGPTSGWAVNHAPGSSPGDTSQSTIDFPGLSVPATGYGGYVMAERRAVEIPVGSTSTVAWLNVFLGYGGLYVSLQAERRAAEALVGIGGTVWTLGSTWRVPPA